MPANDNEQKKMDWEQVFATLGVKMPEDSYPKLKMLRLQRKFNHTRV